MVYDFVVVGAGPPGSRFARQASAAGAEVLLIERGEPGPPLACSGHVSLDIWEYTPEGAKERLLQNEIYGARFHLGGPGSRAYTFYKEEPVSNVIDRVELDRYLADAAVDAGAKLRTGTAFTDFEVIDDGIEVSMSSAETDEVVTGRMLVGSDGPASKVRRASGINEPDETLHGVLGFSDEIDHGDYVDVHLIVDRFFAWRIPRGEAGVEYGLAVPPGSTDAGERLDEFVDGYGVELSRRCSGLIPIGPPDHVTADRTFLIGDAAAQTKPFTGGGILYGMRSADHAAREIDPTDPATLAAYESAWRSDIGREIVLGKLIRRGYSLPRPLQALGLKLTSGEIGVHMDEPTSFFTRKHLRKLLPI